MSFYKTLVGIARDCKTRVSTKNQQGGKDTIQLAHPVASPDLGDWVSSIAEGNCESANWTGKQIENGKEVSRSHSEKAVSPSEAKKLILALIGDRSVSAE